MKKVFYIFRHGETFATKGGWGYGFRIFSAPILPEASPALERMGKYLKDKKTDFNVSSPLLRCRQSVDIIRKFSGKEFTFDKRLNEYFLESRNHFKNRITSLLTTIEEKGYESIAICTHAACMLMLFSQLSAKKDMGKSYSLFSYPPPGVLVIIDGNNIQEINFNTSL